MRKNFRNMGRDLKKKHDEMEKALRGEMPRRVGNVHVNGFKRSFDIGRFNDNGSKKWPEPKRKQGGAFPPPTKSHKTRKTLIGKAGGTLKDLFNVRGSGQKLRIINNAEYAAIHNEGGKVTVTVTQDMRDYAWAMYYKTGHDSWKGLALTKKKRITYTIPKRQFMGHSKKIDNESQIEIDDIIKEIMT
jgi:phage gpG-like protein